MLRIMSCIHLVFKKNALVFFHIFTQPSVRYQKKRKIEKEQTSDLTIEQEPSMGKE